MRRWILRGACFTAEVAAVSRRVVERAMMPGATDAGGLA